MDELRMGAVEARFAELIWCNAPISSGRLAQIAQQELDWKKSTTYTVLKRLCDKGIFRNECGTVTPLLTKAEYEALQSERFVEDTFAGSLPAFLAAFTRRKALTPVEIAMLKDMIESYGED